MSKESKADKGNRGDKDSDDESFDRLIAAFMVTVIKIKFERSNYFLETFDALHAFLERNSYNLGEIIDITYNYSARELVFTPNPRLTEGTHRRHLESIRLWVEQPIQRDIEAFIFAMYETNKLRRELSEVKDQLEKARNQGGMGHGWGHMMFHPFFGPVW